MTHTFFTPSLGYVTEESTRLAFDRDRMVRAETTRQDNKDFLQITRCSSRSSGVRFMITPFK